MKLVIRFNKNRNLSTIPTIRKVSSSGDDLLYPNKCIYYEKLFAFLVIGIGFVVENTISWPLRMTMRMMTPEMDLKRMTRYWFRTSNELFNNISYYSHEGLSLKTTDRTNRPTMNNMSFICSGKKSAKENILWIMEKMEIVKMNIGSIMIWTAVTIAVPRVVWLLQKGIRGRSDGWIDGWKLRVSKKLRVNHVCHKIYIVCVSRRIDRREE